MHLAIDGTLWDTYRPDLYDRMALDVLKSLGQPLSYLGKGPVPPSLPTANWLQADMNVWDKVRPSGFLQRTVPRVMREAGLDRWVTWTGQAIGPTVAPAGGQRIFVKEVASLLWPAGGSGEQNAGGRPAAAIIAKYVEALKDPRAELLVFSTRVAEMFRDDVSAARIHVLPPFFGGSEARAQAPSEEARDAAKAAFGEGKEYFLWLGSLDRQSHWREALKAFSQFKVRQRSRMRLVMAPWRVMDEAFEESLRSYKFRADVTVLDQGLDNWERAAPGAYALLFTPETDELGWVTAAAQRLETPLISTVSSVAREWAGNTVEWVDPRSPESIAEAMLLLFKDEGYRGKLLQAGKGLAETMEEGEVINRYLCHLS
jgi:glycosyltransferase involved in cell wall biosynthesis